jgi:hypothetical protein
MSENTITKSGGASKTYSPFSCYAQVDEHGKPVRRTKQTHPYTYDGFVQERVHLNKKATGTVYTDRLLQWDYQLTRELIAKHFNDGGGDWWNNRSAAQIQEFLRERLEKPNLEVVLVMEYCNQSTGYPVWRIDYSA